MSGQVAHWLKVAAWAAYAIVLFRLAWRFAKGRLSPNTRKVLLYALWLGVPFLALMIGVGAEMLGPLALTVLTSGFAILLAPARQRSN